MVQEQFTATFNVDDVSTAKSSYNFTQQQADYSAIFSTYAQFIGPSYTRYGTTVGVTYPLDPNYGYCGDASNPINLKCITMHPKGQTAFAHELGHVFTQAYPYVYSFNYQGKNSDNVEAAPLYLTGYLSDPKGGGGHGAEQYWRYELGMMNKGNPSPSVYWHDHLVNDSFPFLHKNAAASWSALGSVLKSYTRNYSGPQAETDGYARAEDFYLKLVAAISDANRQQAFMSHLAFWGVPFVPAGTTFVDADNDGVVAGLDYNDNDARISPFLEECQGALCVDDGIDQNQNGVMDEGIMRTHGSETIAMGFDNTAYGTDRGTRRKLYLAAGSTIRITVTSSKPVALAAYAANVAFTDRGPLWWYNDKYGYTDPVAQSSEAANTVLSFTATTSSVPYSPSKMAPLFRRATWAIFGDKSSSWSTHGSRRRRARPSGPRSMRFTGT